MKYSVRRRSLGPIWPPLETDRHRDGGVLVKERSDHPYDEDMVFCPHLIVDDVLPTPTGLCDMHGNEIVKVPEWGFHQDNGT